MKQTFSIIVCGVIAALWLNHAAANAETPPDPVAALKAQADKLYKERSAAHKGGENVLVLPGLVANRKTREIHIDAMGVGMGPHNPIEFLLVSPSSGNDYEALTVSFAEASHVHRALTFIGLSPGRGVDYRKMQFWPKGERVKVMVHAPKVKPAPLIHYVLDKQTGKPLPDQGFVFVGSRMVEDPENAGQKRYAADIYDPRSIISIYNEPDSILDIPRRASQQDVYNRQFFNPELVLPTNCLLDVVITPEHADGKKRVVDLLLKAVAGTEQADFSLQLIGPDRSLAGGFPKVLEEIRRLNEGGHDPFVSVEFGPSLSVGVIQKICAVIDATETEKGMRIEPPRDNQFYFRAFLPKESYRNRKTRITQPWELRLQRENDTVRGQLTQIHADWKGATAEPKLTLTHSAVPDPATLARTLKGPGMNVIFVFVDPAFPYGELLRFLEPVRDTHPLIHVFIDPPGQSDDSTP